MAHFHGHTHGHSHGHDHAHSHGPSSPHPAQPVRWSILRMALAPRLIAAIAISAVLWTIVLVAMR